MQTVVELIKDPVASAKEAGLRYFREDQLTIRRQKRGPNFYYVDEEGDKITDEDTLKRIRSMVLPPAWTNVIISPRPNSHLQAIGVDEKGRKQYRYHPDWIKFRDETKYEKVLMFGSALPKIRARISEDMDRQGLPREKVLATIVKLMEKTMIRVGNEQYAKENKSYGLTTLRNRHVEVTTTKIRINFKGKSGQFHNIEVENTRLARVIRKLQDLPGQELFQYIDEDGEIQGVDSADVNEYIQLASGDEYTAKDFRTWRGTVLAALFLSEAELATSQKENKRLINEAIKQVAMELGNTPSVCRKCYIHPIVMEGWLQGNKPKVDTINEIEVDTVGLLPEERAVLRFLERNSV